MFIVHFFYHSIEKKTFLKILLAPLPHLEFGDVSASSQLIWYLLLSILF